MRRNGMLGLVLLGTALSGCDRIPASIPFIGRKEEPPPVVAAPPDTVPAAPVDTTPTVVSQPAIRPVAMDEPWEPTDTGTVNPGMTRDEVIAIWGPPVAERVRGGDGYLYFRNGCEHSCGTFDAVFLENGQVVDAIVRGVGHTYAGNPSSPPGRTPEPTLPGAPLMLPAVDTTAPAPAPAVAPAPGEDE